MFESGMFASGNTIHTRTRLTLVVSILVQGCLLAALVAIPLLHPEVLHLENFTPIPVPLFTPPPHIVVVTTAASGAHTSAFAMPQQITLAANVAPRLPNPFSPQTAPDAPNGTLAPMGANPGLGNFPVCSDCSGTVAGPGSAGPLHVSSGVMTGRLLVPITPRYPGIAIASRTQGTVQIQATIAANGTIVDAHVVSGPAMLYGAALDAVRGARYAPYKLNGQPVEVETTINIVFNLN